MLWDFPDEMYAKVLISSFIHSPVFSFQISEPNGVKILRMPSPIFFANLEFFRDKLAQAVCMTRALKIEDLQHWVVK